MRIVPTGVYLSWPTPNYENPQTRGVAGKVVAISLMSITTVVLILRFYSRVWVTKGRGLDDALIFAAFVGLPEPPYSWRMLNSVVSGTWVLGRFHHGRDTRRLG